MIKRNSCYLFFGRFSKNINIVTMVDSNYRNSHVKNKDNIIKKSLYNV